MVAGANLNSTDVARKHNKRIYQHHQFEPSVARNRLGMVQPDPASWKTDDFHSPVKPDDYVVLRLIPAKEFYEARIPSYALEERLMKLVQFSLTIVASVLSYLAMSQTVVTVTALAGGVTAWAEFSDRKSKIERYTGAIVQIRRLLIWWNTLSDVEKAGMNNISTLIDNGEAIISDERVAWRSTASDKKDTNKDENQRRKVAATTSSGTSSDSKISPGGED